MGITYNDVRIHRDGHLCNSYANIGPTRWNESFVYGNGKFYSFSGCDASLWWSGKRSIFEYIDDDAIWLSTANH